MKNIAFICVNFNNSAYTEKMLLSLSDQRGRDSDFSIECLVVDNSTQDDDSRALKAICERYLFSRIVNAGGNLGYFGGLNLGLDNLEVDKFDIVLICNNDLYFDSDFSLKLSHSHYLENVFAICPDVVTTDGIHQNPHHLYPLSRFRKFQFDLYFSNYWVGMLLKLVSGAIKNYKKNARKNLTHQRNACEVNQGVGACYALTRAFFKNCGKKLYFPWFLFGEEACLSWQIRSNGGISWYDPELKVAHDENASTSAMPGRTSYKFAQTSYWGFRHLL